MENNKMILWIRGAKQKDPHCQLALINGFKPLIKAMIRRYVYDSHAFEDYLSEGTIVLLNAIDTFDEKLGVPFSGYLKKELFYYFVNVAKNHQNLYSLDATADEDTTALQNSLPDTTDIEGDFLHGADLQALFVYLPKLRERQRWIIDEHYFKNRSFREIANSIGVSSNSLVKLHRRAISDLRTYLGIELVN
ncbi:sigma-70 family RNA polymerase sigma factor [Acetobacterium woodii]|uniref:sigma-70 family RNA polymerase sigma factor n=1 Tax=Acetobacterium woodii TaxID=33952 RepID=UPI0002D60FB8|nr:sigma-70 family RNA polymerase sigma factor [Acetobacterium woodii]